MTWNLACSDWADRIRTGRSLIPALPLFREEADLAQRIFDAIQLPDVPGTPLLRDAAGAWFRDIVGAVFGSCDPATGIRAIREFFALVGKGNSKTSYSAALMLVALLMNVRRPRAEYLLVGPRQAISDKAFRQAAGMIKLDPELTKRFQIREHLKEIVDRKNESVLRVRTFGLEILTGGSPVGVLLDELHILGTSSHTARVLAQLRGGIEKSPEGFLIIITTQSDQEPRGAFKDELQAARDIRDGRATGQMLPILYEFPDDIAEDPHQWQDPANWPMVMPNLGRSLHLDSLMRLWDGERRKGEKAIRVWASQHLNIQIGLGLKTEGWRGADHWLGAVDETLTFDELLARSEVVCMGVDGGGLDDLLGMAAIGRETGTRRWLLWARAWMHRDVLELRKSEAQTFLDLEKAGDLVIVDDLTVAFTEIAQIGRQIDEAGLLSAVGLDPAGVGMIVDALAEHGIEGDDRVKGISQGWPLNGSIKTAEVKLANKTLVHAGQALMSYAVGNARVEPRGNAITITKQASGTAKIDPLMAMFDAVALMSKNPEAAGQSFWNNVEKWESSAASSRPPGQPVETESIRV